MSIASEISRLQTAKSAMATAIEGKGVTVPSSTKLDGYADLISAISQSGGSGVGELTKYQKVKVTPSSNAELSITHTLGVIPKVVLFDGNPDTTSVTYVTCGILGQYAGGVESGNDTSGKHAVRNAYTVLTGTTGTSNSYAYFTSTSVVIRRATSARTFDTNTEYTVELYA